MESSQSLVILSQSSADESLQSAEESSQPRQLNQTQSAVISKQIKLNDADYRDNALMCLQC
jgi:hypothetical protein